MIILCKSILMDIFYNAQWAEARGGKVTIKRLEQYASLRREVADLEKRIKRLEEKSHARVSDRDGYSALYLGSIGQVQLHSSV